VHIITGAIIAALLGNKSKTKVPRSAILNLQGPIYTSHLLPGRVRFHIPILKNNDHQIAKIKENLEKIKGIQSVEANRSTGSILLYFDEAQIKADLLAAALIRLLGLEKELEKTPQPVIPREIRQVGTSLNRAVYDKTGGFIDLWSAIPLLLIVLGGRKLLADRALSTPTAMTLLWWGYNSLFHEKSRCD
jgi:copper chaperone CopZ